VYELAMQVAHVDVVVINDAEPAYASTCQIRNHRRAKAAGPYDEGRGTTEP
jgi:hypothetical protein